MNLSGLFTVLMNSSSRSGSTPSSFRDWIVTEYTSALGEETFLLSCSDSLEDGVSVGMGTHKELLKNCDVYKEIALSQLSKEELENAE